MNVFIRTAAREDILRQFAWYLDENDSPQAARRFMRSVERAIEAITDRPGIGAPKFFANPRLKGLRSWPVPGFPVIRIYYLHSADEIRVVRVLHGKRDLQSILEEESAGEEDL